jgi:hypothetical protein
MTQTDSIESVADRLAALYGAEFGGKPKGRYRVSTKLVRSLWGRKRLYEDDIDALTRAMFERGFILVSLEGFLVVLGANAFVNYRRVNEEAIL